jgi:hypothetical protein
MTYLLFFSSPSLRVSVAVLFFVFQQSQQKLGNQRKDLSPYLLLSS